MNDVVKIKIVDYIVHLADPLEIILFGSYALGLQTNSSDIDLLIVAENIHKREELKKDITQFIFKLGYPCDIILKTENELKNELMDEKSFLFNAIKFSQKIYKKNAKYL